MPIAPNRHLTTADLGEPERRVIAVEYLARHWWAWNSAAIAAADAAYRVENTSLETICELGGLDAPRCADFMANNTRTLGRNHHGGGSSLLIPPVTWSEVCDAAGARTTGLVYALATRLGYKYNATPPCVKVF